MYLETNFAEFGQRQLRLFHHRVFQNVNSDFPTNRLTHFVRLVRYYYFHHRLNLARCYCFVHLSSIVRYCLLYLSKKESTNWKLGNMTLNLNLVSVDKSCWLLSRIFKFYLFTHSYLTRFLAVANKVVSPNYFQTDIVESSTLLLYKFQNKWIDGLRSMKFWQFLSFRVINYLLLCPRTNQNKNVTLNAQQNIFIVAVSM